jgi:GMP synthase (glutamine-hydrolysing)
LTAYFLISSHSFFITFRYYFEHAFLVDVVNKICNNVRGINRVCQDITSKPPATVEWE